MFNKRILIIFFCLILMILGILRVYKYYYKKNWKTYTNKKFNYSISYPDYWKPERFTDNEGGMVLYLDQDNEILIYGTYLRFTFSTQDVPTGRSNFTLNNKITATKLISKEKGNKINYIVFFEKNEFQYIFNAVVTEEYYSKNKNLLDKIAKSINVI